MIAFLFDPDKNFWELNPPYRYYGVFGEIYSRDTSRDKQSSGKKALVACTLWHRNSPYSDMLLDQVGSMIEDNIVKEEGYIEKHQEILDLLKVDIENDKSALQKRIERMECKAEELVSFLESTSWANEIHGGIKMVNIVLSYDKIEAMLSALKRKLREESDDDKGQALGGGELSASSQGLI